MNPIENLLRQTIGLARARPSGSCFDRTGRACRACGAVAFTIGRTISSCCKHSPVEWDALVESVVITETWFFRDQQAFRRWPRWFRKNGCPAYPTGHVRALEPPLLFRRGTLFDGHGLAGSRASPRTGSKSMRWISARARSSRGAGPVWQKFLPRPGSRLPRPSFLFDRGRLRLEPGRAQAGSLSPGQPAGWRLVEGNRSLRFYLLPEPADLF